MEQMLRVQTVKLDEPGFNSTRRALSAYAAEDDEEMTEWMVTMRKLLTSGKVETRERETGGMTWCWRRRGETMEEWWDENEKECEVEKVHPEKKVEMGKNKMVNGSR